MVLDKHNELRRRVAKGEEPGQPGAANMRKLVSDKHCELSSDTCYEGVEQ